VLSTIILNQCFLTVYKIFLDDPDLYLPVGFGVHKSYANYVYMAEKGQSIPGSDDLETWGHLKTTTMEVAVREVQPVRMRI